MSRRRYSGVDVFTAAYERLSAAYAHGDEIVVSVSGGKDSTVLMELTILAARDAGRLPVPVVMRDEEIMAPGTFEYLRRCAARTDEIDLHWVIAGQPVINCFNRLDPYWWVFDPEVSPEKWVRGYPGGPDAALDAAPLPGRAAYVIPQLSITGLTDVNRFPLRGRPGWEDWDALPSAERVARARAGGRETDRARLLVLLGLRVEESSQRTMGLFSSGHWITSAALEGGGLRARPIYDWGTADVWKFIRDEGIDYNSVYDVLTRAGVQGQMQRVAPPTLNPQHIPTLQLYARAFPRWWDRVSDRLDGMRTVAQFGTRAINPPRPDRARGETWESLLRREIARPDLPAWLTERMSKAVEYALSRHAAHATGPLPDTAMCPSCTAMTGSWKILAKRAWQGDPFGSRAIGLRPIEPEFFRPGAGVWGSTEVGF